MEIVLEEFGIGWWTQDKGDIMEYGTHFLALGSSYKRVVVKNGPLTMCMFRCIGKLEFQRWITC